MSLEFTGERFVPSTEVDPSHYEHVHRYIFANQFVNGKKVLDLACGEGYGAKILSENAVEVTGIDIDKTTIEHAKKKYQKNNLKFLEDSVTNLSFKDEKIFDVVTCFETIEHIEEQEQMLKEVRRVLKDDGIFILSTPNKPVYNQGRDEKNPFHVKELDFNEFKNLLISIFPNICIFSQKSSITSCIWENNTESDNFKEILVNRKDDEYIQATEEKKPVYFLAIASKNNLPNITIKNSYLTDLGDLRTYVKKLEHVLEKKTSQLSKSKPYVKKLEEELNNKKTNLQKLEELVEKERNYHKELEKEFEEKSEKIESMEKNRRKYYSSRL